MKSKYKISLLLLLTVQSLASYAQDFTYTIKGAIKGLNNDTLIFNYFDADGKNKTIKTPGRADQFSISGKASQPSLVFAEISQRRKEGNFTFFIDQGTIQVFGDAKEMGHIAVTGTAINDDYAKGNKITNEFYQRRNELFKQSQL